MSTLYIHTYVSSSVNALFSTSAQELTPVHTHPAEQSCALRARSPLREALLCCGRRSVSSPTNISYFFIFLDPASLPGSAGVALQDGENLRQQVSEEGRDQSRLGAARPHPERHQRLLFSRHGKPSGHFLYGRPHTVKDEPTLGPVQFADGSTEAVSFSLHRIYNTSDVTCDPSLLTSIRWVQLRRGLIDRVLQEVSNSGQRAKDFFNKYQRWPATLSKF